MLGQRGRNKQTSFMIGVRSLSRGDLAVRQRLKVHSQNLAVASVVPHSPRRRELFCLSKRLSELREFHRSTNSSSARSEASEILKGVAPFSVDDDSSFIVSQRMLRAIAYFELFDLPIKESLVWLHAKHTYLLDAQALSSFAVMIPQLHLTNATDVVRVLMPRMAQLADDFHHHEAAGLLELICTFAGAEARTSQLLAVLEERIARNLEDSPPADILELIRSCALTSRQRAAAMLVREDKRIADAIAGSSKAQQPSLVMAACRATTAASYGPRSIMSAITRSAVERVKDLRPQQISLVMKALQATSYRHERAMLRLSTEQLLRGAEQTPGTALATLQCLAHFYVSDKEIFEGLLGNVVNDLNGVQTAEWMSTFARARIASPVLFDKPLVHFARDAQRQSCNSVQRVLCSVVELGLFDRALAQPHVEKLLDFLEVNSDRLDPEGRVAVVEACAAIGDQCVTSALGEKARIVGQSLKSSTVSA